MANKIKMMSQKADVLEDARQTPLLDLSDAAVKELVRTAKKRGYVVHDQINSLLASDEVNSEQIENILAKFSEMGINVVEIKEARLEEEVVADEKPEEEETEGGNELAEIQRQRTRRANGRPCAPVSPRDGFDGTALPRGRDRHRQAHRGRS